MFLRIDAQKLFRANSEEIPAISIFRAISLFR